MAAQSIIPEATLKSLAQRHGLSNAETEALNLAVSGSSTAEMAACLGITSEAVRKRLSNIYKRFKISGGSGPGKLNRLQHILLLETQAEEGLDSSLTLAKPAEEAPREDWGEAVDVSTFYGRVAELQQMQQWITQYDCQLLSLKGAGGIGKTSLAVKLVKEVQGGFDCIIFKSLRNVPPIQELVRDLISFIAWEGSASELDIDQDIAQLVQMLNQHRCLIILDNFESVLKEGDLRGGYRESCEAYGTLLTQLGERKHRSAVILTCREKPNEILTMELDRLPVRTLELSGLDTENARRVLDDRKLSGTVDDLKRLIEHYKGHPLILKMIASEIEDLFGLDVAEFFKRRQDQNLNVIPDNIYHLFDQQFSRLSNLEKSVLYQIATYRRRVSLGELQDDLFFSPELTRGLVPSIKALKRRSLIEQVQGQSMLHEIISECLIKQLVNRICDEFETQQFELLNQLVLMKVTSEEHDRENQKRLILEPLKGALVNRLGSVEQVQLKLETTLKQLQNQHPRQDGYAAGNIINLLRQLGTVDDFNEQDYARLVLWQADFTGISLRQTNFTDADLGNSVFSDILGSAISVAFSARGDLLAMGDADGRVRVWEVRGKTLVLKHNFKEHSGWVWSVCFSPDGEILASASADKTVKLWKIQGRRSGCLQTLDDPKSVVRSVSFSRDFDYSRSTGLLAAASESNEVLLWDVSNLFEVLEQLPGISVAFGELDGETIIATGCNAQEHNLVKLWRLSERTISFWRDFVGHSEPVLRVTFSPDGQMLASSSHDATVRLWRVQDSGAAQILQGHDRWVRSISFSPDGQYLASGSDDCTIRVWQVEDGRCINVLEAHNDQVLSVAFSPDGHNFVSGGDDKTLRLWTIEPPCRSDLVARETSDPAPTLSITPSRTLKGYTSWVWSISFSPDGMTLAIASDDYTIRLWQRHDQTAQWQLAHTLKGHTNRVWAVAFSPDGQFLASGSGDYDVKIWDLRRLECIKTLKRHTDRVRTVKFSPTGNYLVSGSADTTVALWRLKTGECVATFGQGQERYAAPESFPELGHSDEVWAAAFHPNGKVLATASSDRKVILWDVSTRQQLTHVTYSGEVWSVAFSPDGCLLAAGGAGMMANHQVTGLLSIRETETYQEIACLEGHTDQVHSVAFSPDGKFLASSGNDHTVKVWDLETFTLVHSFTEHTNWVWSVAFHPVMSALLASGSQDETVRLWDLTTGTAVETLQNRPCEGMNLTRVTGLSLAQKEVLRELGAIDQGIEGRSS